MAMTTTPSLAMHWRTNPAHRRWLFDQAQALLGFYQYAVRDPAGGFHELTDEGAPSGQPARQLVVTSRMVHCFSIGCLLGRPGCTALVDHGLRFLADHHRDPDHRGFAWIAGPDGIANLDKEAYGHAFVLLAASSALVAGRPGARKLLDEVTDVLVERFWSEQDGLFAETFTPDWAERDSYRGANSNMHLVEALMAAAEATGDRGYVERAVRVAERLIGQITAANDWRIAEHYTDEWRIDAEYNVDDPEHMYRPYGSIPGHWLEWSRLLLQLRALTRPSEDWLLDAARRLFAGAIDQAWDADGGGFAYTVDFTGRRLNADRYYWVHAEAIGAATYLSDVTGEAAYEERYRTFWDFVDDAFVDHARGGWHYVLTPDNEPKHVPGVVAGKPDLYHALQACLIPLLPTDAGIVAGLHAGRLALS
jgi:sulfoquinovose isomerase